MHAPTSSGFTGAYGDPAIGGYPLGNGYRWYLPSLMRFNAPDGESPFDAGGLNPYAYCAADPVNRADPDGHAWKTVLSEESERLGTTATEAADSGPRNQSIGAASASLADKPLGTRERQLASSAFHHWHGLVETSVERIATLNEVLPLMGKRVKTVDEFFDHFESGRVVVQANTRPGIVESGHSVLYFNKGQYELMRDAEGSIDSAYQAKYSKGGYRNYIYSRIPSSAEYPRYRSLLSEKVQYMINKRVLFVLNEKYSPHFMAAFEAERRAFTKLPYSYGMRYNCHRFVFEILRILYDLAD
ncbi:RHS repeat-associated core domain-containing protein [Trinickia diaoshuihuensis]|uniref:RHS repeat-associated core domain-containing protein n=1 Tax=Trinickia diaoshuihuensis TaxID=2292265 RepID=UPI000E23318C|nr:RHS repeat-associated core domain-containing protein [Trinickia diaoshuihuensis]